MNSLRNIDVVKTAAIEIRKSLLDVNNGHENSFCDANQLKEFLKETKILDFCLSFFAALFNVSSTKQMRSEVISSIDSFIFENCLVKQGNEEETQDSLLMNRTKSLFQILFYHVTKRRNNPLHPPSLHVMKAYTICKCCRSRELITSFNRQSICIFTVFHSSECQVPLPRHFY